MNFYRTYFSENPMMVEITRFRRRFLGGNSLNTIILALTVLIYIGIVALVWSYRDAANPLLLIMLQTFIFTLLGPAMLYGSIAGERERRSWDFLLVAPVSQGQIVVGKFMGAASAILVCAIAFLLPILIGTVSYESYTWGSGYGTSLRSDLWQVFKGELISISWGLLVCAVTIFFSARCRRGFIALGTVLALFLCALIIWPILLASSMRYNSGSDFLLFYHPFMALARLEPTRIRLQDPFQVAFGWPQIFSYFLLSGVFLFWTEKTLRFADTEVKFLPKQRDA